MNIAEIRAKYPQYKDVSDGDLTNALHKRYYSDIPLDAFRAKVGFKPEMVVGADGLQAAVKQTVQESGPLTNAAVGFKSSIDDAAMRLKQLFSTLTDEDKQAIQSNRTLRDTSIAGLLGSIGGDVAMTAVPGAGVIQGASNAVKAAPAVVRALAPTVASAAVGAGTAAAMQPVLDGESGARNAAMGAVGGALGDIAPRVASRVVQPLAQSAPVKKLLSEGIVPTPGGAAGADSFLGRVEQKLQSVPIIGDLVKRGRDRATEELNVAAINRALPKTAKGQITASGRESITEAHRIVSEGYDDVLSRITVKPDMPFMRQVISVTKDPELSLPPAQQQRLVEIVRSNVLARMKNGELSGESAKKVESILGSLGTRYSRAQDPDQLALGMALRQIQGSFRELLGRNAAGADAALLQELNKNYSSLLRVERAASYVGNEGGKFSANQLQSAVRALDPSKNKRAFAQGRAPMQDLSDAARQTIGGTVADSGTAGRMLTAMALGGGAAGVNEYMDGPAALSALALSPLLYSRAGSRYAVGNLPGQQALSGTLRGLAPYAALIGASGTSQ